MTSDDENPTVTLGGTTYPVPPVAFREVSKILPLVGTVLPAMRSGAMTEETLERLGRLIYLGIKGGTTIGYDEFIDRPATLDEMMAATLTVCRQAGLKLKESPVGEAPAAASPPT